jgi:protein-tyrosine phosphatase
MPGDAKLVVDLTAEFAEPEHLRTAADYRCLPVLDGSVPNLERFDALVQELADFQGPIFVHCAAGHGRSGMVAAAVLVRRGEAADVHEAIDRMRKARPRIRLGRRQRRLVERLQPVTPAWAAA